MPRTSRIAARLLLTVAALVAAVGALPAGAGDVIILPRVRLSSAPIARALAGTEVELEALVDDPKLDTRIPGSVVFFDGDVPIGEADLVQSDDVIGARASIVYTVVQGVRELSARYESTSPDIASATSPVVLYSGLPAACPDQATPGAGALARLAYLTVLGRCPDPAGFGYWTGRLTGGTSPTTMARALALSAEGIGATVDTAYRRVLDRPADAGGRAVWAAKLRAGWTTSQLWAALAASPEFIAGAPGADRTGALVDRAFTRLVGRPADDGSRTYWYGRLLSGAPRSATLRALILTPEALGHVVRATFESILGRAASPIEQTAAQTAIKARRGDWRLLAAELLGWPEASIYAQRYPDPEVDG